MFKTLIPKMAACFLAAASASAMGSPVSFNISSVSLTPGAGYGIDANEATGTLLDVRFSTAGFMAQNFTLSAVGNSFSFILGTVELLETDAHGGILAAETDELWVRPDFNFITPTGPKFLTTQGEPTVGLVNDNQQDFALKWDTLKNIAYGTGGQFDISFHTLNFKNNTEGPQDLRATITLRALATGQQAQTQTQQTVPEPGSLALVGAALALAGLARRKRRAGV